MDGRDGGVILAHLNRIVMMFCFVVLHWKDGLYCILRIDAYNFLIPFVTAHMLNSKLQVKGGLDSDAVGVQSATYN